MPLFMRKKINFLTKPKILHQQLKKTQYLNPKNVNT